MVQSEVQNCLSINQEEITISLTWACFSRDTDLVIPLFLCCRESDELDSNVAVLSDTGIDCCTACKVRYSFLMQDVGQAIKNASIAVLPMLR